MAELLSTSLSSVLYADALQRVRHLAHSRAQLSFEDLSPQAALGRVVARAVQSPRDVPQYANSAVDGFALRSSDLVGVNESSPREFQVKGQIIAGHTPPKSLPFSGESSPVAWQIMTGGPFPEGFDCSIKIEETEVIRDSKGFAREIVVRKYLDAFENLRDAGEDFKKDDGVLNPGDVIGPEQILALEALGISKVSVLRKLRVAVISTGGELSASSSSLRDGQIPNSTAPFLRAALQLMGAEPVLLDAVGDDPKEYFSLLQKVLATEPDLIISTGAVSMGVHDYVSQVIRDTGGKTEFHGVAIRPGKPLLVAEFPGKGPVFFGLPGNPVATVVGLRFFVDPFMRVRLGQPEEKPSWARVTENVRKPEGLRCFFKAQVVLGKAEPAVTILPGQASFMMSPLLHSTAWGVLPEAAREIQKGEWVEVFPFYSSPYSWSQSSAVSNPKSEKGCC